MGAARHGRQRLPRNDDLLHLRRALIDAQGADLAIEPLDRMARDDAEAAEQLDRRVDDLVELYVGDRLIARGELQELEGDQAGQLAVRLTEVANLRGGL